MIKILCVYLVSVLVQLKCLVTYLLDTLKITFSFQNFQKVSLATAHLFLLYSLETTHSRCLNPNSSFPAICTGKPSGPSQKPDAQPGSPIDPQPLILSYFQIHHYPCPFASWIAHSIALLFRSLFLFSLGSTWAKAYLTLFLKRIHSNTQGKGQNQILTICRIMASNFENVNV